MSTLIKIIRFLFKPLPVFLCKCDVISWRKFYGEVLLQLQRTAQAFYLCLYKPTLRWRIFLFMSFAKETSRSEMSQEKLRIFIPK